MSLAMIMVLALVPARATNPQLHAPILIRSNGDFTADNGIKGGNGTATDPYIIEGWDIATSARVPGIMISNTDAYFVILNVYIHTVRPSYLDYPGYGINMTNVSNGAVEDSTITVCCWSITLDSSSKITVSNDSVSFLTVRSSRDVTVSGSGLQPYCIVPIISSDNITLTGNTCGAFQIVDSTRVTMQHNTLSLDIVIRGASPEEFDSFRVTPDNMVDGRPLLFYKDCSGLNLDSIEAGELIVANCNRVNLINLTFDNFWGIDLETAFVTNTIITNTTASNTILVTESSGVEVSRNRAADIEVDSSVRIQISDNVANVDVSSSASVFLRGNQARVGIVDSFNVGLSDNRLEGVCDCTALTIQNSDHVTVSGNNVVGEPGIQVDDSAFLNISNNRVVGIIMSSCSDIAIQRNQVEVGSGASPPWAVGLNACSGVNIVENDIAGWGPSLVVQDELIKISLSDNVTITGNTLSNATTAMDFFHSSNIGINDNTFQSNAQGVVLGETTSVRVFHNNFFYNMVQAIDANSTQNAWDNGYPSGGNYWSDYAAVDNCSGPNQDVCPDPDGIADQPRPTSPTFAGYGVDLYPLMKPFAPLISGTVRFQPTSITSQGARTYLTAVIGLPHGFIASNLVTSSIHLNQTISAARVTIVIQPNKAPVLTVAFYLTEVKALLSKPGPYVLQISANILTSNNFRPFEATSTIRLLPA